MNEGNALNAVSFPDAATLRRYEALVGMDEVKAELLTTLRVALRPQKLRKWSDANPGSKAIVDLLLERPQLFILAGDVGTGKTELAQTIGDAVARVERSTVTLFSMSLAMRGTGLVGEMTQRIVAAFDEVRQWGEKRKHQRGESSIGILFIDEADAVAQSRESSQMHHEDRAGVNALIRGIDDLTQARVPVATIMATNRLDALDPAVRRRAAVTFMFVRPNSQQRRALLVRLLPREMHSSRAFDDLLTLTGENGTRPFGYTYSDIVQRLLPRAALDAFASNEPLSLDAILALAKRTEPTPPFEGAG